MDSDLLLLVIYTSLTPCVTLHRCDKWYREGRPHNPYVIAGNVHEARYSLSRW